MSTEYFISILQTQSLGNLLSPFLTKTLYEGIATYIPHIIGSSGPKRKTENTSTPLDIDSFDLIVKAK